jgi:hypothetical protein
VRAADLGALVPVQPEPAEVFEELLVRGGDVAGLVGVLDADDELAAQSFGKEVAEQRRAGAADVEVPGGRRGEAGSDGVDHGFEHFFRVYGSLPGVHPVRFGSVAGLMGGGDRGTGPTGGRQAGMCYTARFEHKASKED